MPLQRKIFKYDKPFLLDSGATLEALQLCYHTMGTLNEDKNNVIWVFHALTANSDASEWWTGLVGANDLINGGNHFVICVNILGSCYGSTGPLSTNPSTEKPYYQDFPAISIRDMIQAYKLLASALDIKEVAIAIGGSMGGYQAMEWAIDSPDFFKKLVLVATSPKESNWGKSIHEAQRNAIIKDQTFGEESENAGKDGLIAARAIGMLTYRTPENFSINQQDPAAATHNFRAESYIKYQGNKLAKRFNAYSYYALTLAMDGHDVGRDRVDTENALAQITAKTLIIAIDQDILCPPSESNHMSNYIPDSRFVIIRSHYGHDGFLTEHVKISSEIKKFLTNL